MTFSDDTNDVWFNAVSNFVNIIDAYNSWSVYFIRDYPNVGAYMWTEEADDNYADYTEMSIILGHNGPIVYYGGKYYTSIGFADKGYACPWDVRLSKP